MNMLKIILALGVLVSLGAQCAFADTDVARGSLSSAAGRVDWATTYKGTPTTVTAVQQTAHALPEAITVRAEGMTIQKADLINSYLWAQSSGGDTASVHATIGAHIYADQTELADGLGGETSVKNYAMYGYVTPDFAYAGQYADEIESPTYYLEAIAFNHGKLVPDTVTKEADGTQATFEPPAVAAYDAGAGILTNPAYSGATEYACSDNVIRNLDGIDLDGIGTGTATLSKIYQFAQAGGSATPEKWSTNGAWAMTDVDKGGSISVPIVAATDGAEITTTAQYINGASFMKPIPGMAAKPLDVKLSGTPGSKSTITINSGTAMGYADSLLYYANADVNLATNLAGASVVATSSTSSDTRGIYSILEQTSQVNPNAYYFSGQKNVFVYSLINGDNKDGVSKAIWY